MLVGEDWNRPAIQSAIQVLHSGEITDFIAQDAAYGTVFYGIERLPGNQIKIRTQSLGGTCKRKVLEVSDLEQRLNRKWLHPWTSDQEKMYRSKRVPIDDDGAATLALAIVRHCFRNTDIETIHAGPDPETRTGDYSDVTVVHAEGRTSWRDVRRIGEAEIQMLRREMVNNVYTVLRHLHEPVYFNWIMYEGNVTKLKWDDPSLEKGLPPRQADSGGVLLDDSHSSSIALAITRHFVECREMMLLQDGVWPTTQTGDYEDVTVVSPGGEIQWNELGRISDDEMKALMRGAVRSTYRILRVLGEPEFFEMFRIGGEQVRARWGSPKPCPELGG